MTRVDTRVPTDARLRSLPMTAEMPELGDYLSMNFDAVASRNRGASAPPDPIDGTMWWDTAVDGAEIPRSFRSPDGWTEIGQRATRTGGVFTPAPHTHPYAPLSHVGAGGMDRHPAATTDLAGFISSSDKGELDDHIGAGGSSHSAVSPSVDGFATPAMLLAGVPVGMIATFPADTMPTGWLTCAGQAISRSAHAALFAVFGTTFGAGDGSTTFNLPDGRVVIGSGQGTGLAARAIGAVGGQEKHTLSVGEPPGHTHSGDTSGQSLNHTHDVCITTQTPRRTRTCSRSSF